MSRGQLLTLALTGAALLVIGLFLLFGPWALVGCGLALVLVALLLPVRERRGEPVDDAAATRR